MPQRKKYPWYCWIPVFGAIPLFFIDREDEPELYETFYFEYQIVWLCIAGTVLMAFLLLTFTNIQNLHHGS